VHLHHQRDARHPRQHADDRQAADVDRGQVMGAEPIESWRDILGPQALDLAVLAAFIALALVSFFRRSERLKIVTLVAAVGYMGFMKSPLVSIVDIFGALDRTLPVFKYSLAWYLFTGFTVVSTVLWGRLYCGRICAFGSLTQLLDTVVPKRF